MGIPGIGFRSAGLVAGQLSRLIGLGLVISEGGRRMRTTQIAILESQWEEGAWLSRAGDSPNWDGVEYQETGRSWGFDLLDDFQPFYPLDSLVLAFCDGFNLDVEKPTVFREDAAGFGQTVVQFGGSR